MKCAYASAILDAINFALSQNANLFSSTELGSLARVAALPYPCVRVIGRLLTRKVKWVKLASILEYIDELESVEQQDVITALLDGGLLLSLLGQDQFSEVWEVAESSFVSDDWNWLSQRLTGGRPKSGSRKEETIRLVRQTMESQKTCFGTSLKQRFVDSVRSLCRASPGGDWVRLQADISVLLRRVQRLLQAPSDVSGAADVSAFKPLEVCVPLFVTFRLMQLPAYDLFSLHTQAESVLFSDRACFHHWEAAMELRHALVEVSRLRRRPCRLASPSTVSRTAGPSLSPKGRRPVGDASEGRVGHPQSRRVLRLRVALRRVALRALRVACRRPRAVRRCLRR